MGRCLNEGNKHDCRTSSAQPWVVRSDTLHMFTRLHLSRDSWRHRAEPRSVLANSPHRNSLQCLLQHRHATASAPFERISSIASARRLHPIGVAIYGQIFWVLIKLSNIFCSPTLGPIPVHHDGQSNPDWSDQKARGATCKPPPRRVRSLVLGELFVGT